MTEGSVPMEEDYTVMAPDGTVAWAAGWWLKYDDELRHAFDECPDQVLVVERDEPHGQGWIRDIRGAAPLGALVEVSGQLERLREEVAKTFAMAALALGESGLADLQQFATGLHKVATRVAPEVAATVYRWAEGNLDGWGEGSS